MVLVLIPSLKKQKHVKIIQSFWYLVSLSVCVSFPISNSPISAAFHSHFLSSGDSCFAGKIKNTLLKYTSIDCLASSFSWLDELKNITCLWVSNRS